MLQEDQTDTEDRQNALSMESVVKTFGNVRAVDGVDIHIKDGERVALLGENGAGKSTTIRIISGLMRPDSGRVRIYGFRPSSVDAKRYIGYLPEDASPYLNLSIRENLDYIGTIRKTENLQEKIEFFLDLLGLKSVEKQKPLTLSRGNRQKLCLALSIIHGPRFAIMDEPLNYLDIPTQEKVFQYFEKMNATFLISTHILSIAKRLTEKIIILSSGKKVWEGKIAELEELKGESKSIETIVSELMRNVP
ncbi:MAG: ABC transporter ATP-binding protein [Cuniculiplasma sp.]